jgi:ribosomal protein S8
MNINSINLLTKIKNASIRKKEACLIENTKFNQKIIRITIAISNKMSSIISSS